MLQALLADKFINFIIYSSNLTFARETADSAGWGNVFYNLLSYMSLSFVVTPSRRLSELLLKHNLPNPVYILEYCENKNNVVTNDAKVPNRPRESVNKTLNSVSGVYLCINLFNGNMYVGSSYLNSMFRRFRGHLYLATSGSKIVKISVLKYGLINFAFLVIETIPATNRAQDKKALLSLEQKYIDLLKPAYNILKIRPPLWGRRQY